LEQIDPDRGRAIVKLAHMASWEEPERRRLVEIVQVTGDAGLVIIAPTRLMKRISFLQMVEVAPGRFLLALAPGHGFHQLEIALTDLLDEVDDEEPRERQIISELLGHLKNFRKSKGVSMVQILLVRMKP
jgi:hypothetical protein